MTIPSKYWRWFPLALLIALAFLFEPMRSGFSLTNQTCEILTDWESLKAAIFNLRHILSYGVLFAIAACTMGRYKTLKAAVVIFLISILLEIEQSFFTTGHCRLRDLVPNLIGIGSAAVFYSIGSICWNKMAYRR